MGKEIERKWIIKDYPNDIHIINHWCVEQLYLCTDPEVRLRRRVDFHSSVIDYKLTIKSDGTLIRSEFEIPIDETIWNEGRAAAGVPIVKNFYKFEYKGIIYEMSFVDNKFIYIEVEFETIEDANNFVFPWSDLVIEEVTNNPYYKMKNYWIRKHASSDLMDKSKDFFNPFAWDSNPFWGVKL